MQASRAVLAVAALAACSSPAGKPPPITPLPVAATPDAAPVALAIPATDPDPTCHPAPPAPPPTASTDPDNDDHTPAYWAGHSDSGHLVKSTNACAVADNNLTRDEAAILAAQDDVKPARATPWNHKTPLARLDLVQRRFALQPDELARLRATGVAVPARLEQPSFTYAYHEIFQSQLPVYITADSIFHAVFASHDTIVKTIEQEELAPALDGALDAMHCALPAASADYPPDVARDLDLYLSVARALATGTDPAPKLGDPAVATQAKQLVDAATAAGALTKVTMFGRERLIDFTQYGPRGHYAESEPLKQFFRGAMWASRLEFNLVSRSSRSSSPGPEPDPRETPREALDALALADLAHRSGADPAFTKLDRAWAVLAGRREDVSIDNLNALRAKAGIARLTDAHAFEAFAAAIGPDYQRTVRMHPMPEGSRVLPAIATLLGPRVVTDAQAIMPLVASAVPDRTRLGIADIAYSLGFDPAKRYLAADLATFPNLDTQLDVARKVVHDAPPGDDLYDAWFGAIRALAIAPTGTTPSFASTDVGHDLRLNTITAAYGQIKHDYVLVAGQSYSDFGCEIPDGYVEPVPAAYDALIVYATRGAALAQLVDPGGDLQVAEHFARMKNVLLVLRTIAAHELEGRALTATEKHWLGMVAELSQDRSVDTTGFPPTYTGWYFDLFYRRQDDGMRGADLVADYFTSPDGVAYAGASAPRMGLFAVDVGGEPRVLVGPVAHAYEVFGPLAKRLTDETADSLPHAEAWSASYTVAAPAHADAPDGLQVAIDDDKHELVVTAKTALGAATITVLDHHRVPITTRRLTIAQGENRVALGTKRKVGALFVEIGTFRDWAVEDAYGGVSRRWGKDPDAPAN